MRRLSAHFSFHRRSVRLPPPEDPSRCMKYILFFMNVLFWIIGSLILAIGIYIMLELKDFINKFSDLFFQPAIIFVVVGGLLFIITFFGCIGALRENTCLLAVYGGCVALILILLIACGVLGYTNRSAVETAIDKKIREAIILYRDPSKLDLQFLIDSTQTEFKCCGSRSYQDWRSNVYFNCSSPGSESCGVPFSCCKAKLQANRQCGYGVGLLSSYNEREKRINVKGCLTKGILWIQENLYLVIGVCAGLLILIILTVCITFSFRSQVQQIKEYAEKNNKRPRSKFN